MSDFSDKINELLSNPESLSKIMQIAQNLGVGQNGAASSAAQPATQQANFANADAVQSAAQTTSSGQAPMDSEQSGSSQPEDVQSAIAQNAPSQNSLGALGSLLSSGGAQNLLNSGSQSSVSDKRIALLKALKPFMSESKQKRVDNVISAITISSTLGKLKGV